MTLFVYLKSVGTTTNTNRRNCLSLAQLIQGMQKELVIHNKEERYYQTRKIKTRKPRCVMKLNQVLSSDRVYPIHGLSWHKKSLCL